MMDESRPRQRLRATFSRGEDVKYITHLDLIRCWERMLRRARLPLSYSTADVPRPRLSLAAPLAVGVTSEGELAEFFLETRLPPAQLLQRLALECPAGIAISAMQEVGLGLPAIQALVRFADYRVSLLAGSLAAGELSRRVDALLDARTLPWERRREQEVRRYDLRPLIEGLWLDKRPAAAAILGMRLQADERATGRPDDVAAALGLGGAVQSIHRTRLVLAAPAEATRRPGAARH